MKSDIAIIGAGLTGMTAAEMLTENGYGCEIFEKSRGLGGRMSTKRKNWGWLDLGAQYFTARNSGFKTTVQKWIERGVVEPWRATMLTYDGNRLMSSPDDTVRYVGTPKINAMFEKWKTDPEYNVIKETKIISIKPRQKNYLLIDDKGAEYGPFSAVISTLPYDQATEVFNEQIKRDEFSSAYRMAPTWAVGFQFEQPVEVKTYTDIGGIFVKQSKLSWISHNSSKPGRRQHEANDTWILHFNANWSAKYITASESWINTQAIEEFEKILGQKAMNVSNQITHRWKYARNAEKNIPENPGFLTTEYSNCYVAGDWTLGGRIENAFLSGRAIARQLMKL